MPDNVDTKVATNVPVATDVVTYSGDASQNVQLVRIVGVTGAEGSKTVQDFAVSTAFADGESNTQNVLATEAYSMSFNGTTWDRTRGNTSGNFQQGAIAHDGVDSGNPVKIGMRAIAHGTNPTAVAAADRTDWLANRAGVPFVIGGHPNVVSYGMSITTGATNAIIGPTIAAGLKLVVTAITVILDNASTVFPSVVIGFGTASTPAFATTPGTLKVIAGHPAVPAGGGFSRGDGSGIIGVGADDEELRITTVGTAGGNGLYVLLTGYTVES